MGSKSRDWVMLTLAIGLALAIDLLTAGVLYDAIFSEGPGLSDNATQILTTAFGGIIGVLGGYVGYKAGVSNGKDQTNSAEKENVNGDTM